MFKFLALLLCQAFCGFVRVYAQELPPFELVKHVENDGAAWRKRMGIIILDSDETIEEEFPKLLDLPYGAVLYHSRLGKGPAVTADSLTKLQQDIPDSAALFPGPGRLHLPAFQYDAIGFACTSASVEIGEDKLANLVAEGLQSVGGSIPTALVTNPLTAAKRALHAVGAKKIAILTPYTKDISVAEVNNFIADGFVVEHIAYYNITLDNVISRVAPESTRAAILELAKRGHVDAVFVSCTNLRILPILKDVEDLVGVPVISSNTAMAWDMLRLAGLSSSGSPAGGRLFQSPREQHTSPWIRLLV
eukprot:TRINITY_DN4563_c0_g1_i2.p1 TRINITY_DN4563_c0_g1~~TRINITY_DN4563_c0_g1_i2.p1  ORF type:complete len:305 (+),score=40.11 TRINITY_DN4563_c0_g1_i2:107-1021(+)